MLLAHEPSVRHTHQVLREGSCLICGVVQCDVVWCDVMIRGEREGIIKLNIIDCDF